MSLVGTRPILQDELQKYELHHRARIRSVFYYQNKNTKWRYIVKVVFPPLQTVEIGEIIGGGYTSRTL